MIFNGVATAMITPMNKTGVDYESFEKFINFQVENDIDALLVCGTTGEPATLTPKERVEVIKFAIDNIDHQVPVIVGTGSNNTALAIDLTKEAEEMGADAALLVTPYYNKCTQNGLYEHFKAIADSTSLPIFVYNVPSRTGVNILPTTLQRLAEIKNIVGIKEAAGNLDQIKEMIKLTKGSQLKVFSGDDSMALDLVKAGGAGLLSVASNIMPREMHNFMQAALNGDYTAADALNEQYKGIFKELFCEVNPIPVKYAAYKMGLCENYLRLPLTKLEAQHKKQVDDELKNLNLI